MQIFFHKPLTEMWKLFLLAYLYSSKTIQQVSQVWWKCCFSGFMKLFSHQCRCCLYLFMLAGNMFIINWDCWLLFIHLCHSSAVFGSAQCHMSDSRQCSSKQRMKKCLFWLQVSSCRLAQDICPCCHNIMAIVISSQFLPPIVVWRID